MIDKCRWEKTFFKSDLLQYVYYTGCDEECFLDLKLENPNNNYKNCPHCGKEIEEIKE